MLLAGISGKAFTLLFLLFGSIQFALVHAHDFTASAAKQSLSLVVCVQDAPRFHVNKEGGIAQMFKEVAVFVAGQGRALNAVVAEI